MNSLVDEYRKIVPNDSRSDDEITLLLGRQNDIDHRYDDHHDFLDEYSRLSKPETVEPPIVFPKNPAETLVQGARYGAKEAGAAYYGLGALASDLVGADSLKKTFAEKSLEKSQEAEEFKPTVDRFTDIKSVGDVAKYALFHLGEFAPSLLEAGAAGLAGAVAGSFAEPVGGTAVGGVGAFLGSFFTKQAARSLLKTQLEKIAGKEARRAIVDNLLDKQVAEKIIERATADAIRDQLKAVASGTLKEELLPGTSDLLKQGVQSAVSRYGANTINALNFGSQQAGGTYSALSQNPNIADSDAAWGAIMSGSFGAAGVLLPSSAITQKIFSGPSATLVKKLAEGETATPFKDYFQRLFTDAAKHFPIGASGMAVMELGNIAAEKFADPSKRGEGLSDDDWSRLMNAGLLGGGMAIATAPISAIPKPRTVSPILNHAMEQVPEARQMQIAALVRRAELGPPNELDINSWRQLNPNEQVVAGFFKSLSFKERNKFVAGADTPEEDFGSAPPVPVEPVPPKPPPVPAEAVPPKTPPVPSEPVPVNPLRAAADAALRGESATERIARERMRAKVDAAAAKTDTNPTPEEKESGKYKKGRVTIDGIKIDIENPKGSTRTSTELNPDGTPVWTVPNMPAHYGEIPGVKVADSSRGKDWLDVYIGDNPTSEKVWVVDQIDPKTGRYDEPKSLLAFDTREQAIAAYDAGFSDGSGPSRRGAVTEMTRDQFKSWIKSDGPKKPLAYTEPKAAKPSLPELRPGDRRIQIQQPDGAIIEGVTNGKDWEVGGVKIPNVGRVVEIKPGEFLWSDGPLRPGEQIIEPKETNAPKTRIEPGRVEPELPRATPREAVPANAPEVRKAEGAGPNDRRGPVKSPPEPKPENAPKSVESVLKPRVELVKQLELSDKPVVQADGKKVPARVAEKRIKSRMDALLKILDCVRAA